MKFYFTIFQVDGQWSDWSEWLPCDKSCGGGNEIRHRNCTNPAPGVNGYPCSGSSTESKACNSLTCPSNNRYKYFKTKMKSHKQ